MSTAVVTEPMADPSPRSKARIAGVYYLLTILTGTFSFYAGGRLVVSGDAAATATNILANESLYRVGFASNLIATVCYIVVAALFYHLFKPVNRTVALVATFLSLVGCASGAPTGVFHLAPLTIFGGASYLNVFSADQLQALAYLSLRLQGIGHHISMTFFGFYCILIGYLIYKSTFMPRLVGGLMVFAGLGWLTGSFASFLSPSLSSRLVPYIMAPGGIGETSLCVWLLVKGVNAQRWNERANAAVTP